MNHKTKTAMRFCFSAFIVLLGALAGCSGIGESKGDTQAQVSDGLAEADIKLVVLKDGTRCAVLIGSYKGAIHCSW